MNICSRRERRRALLAAALLCLAPAAFGALKAGDPAPSLSGFALEGALPDLQGKVVLIDFWASWCGPCKRSFPVLNALHRDFKDRGLVVLGVNVDEKKEAMQKFMKDTSPLFPCVRDAAHKLVAHAGAEKMPCSLLIGRDGRVVSVHQGFKGKDSEKELREKIEALLAPAGAKK